MKNIPPYTLQRPRSDVACVRMPPRKADGRDGMRAGVLRKRRAALERELEVLERRRTRVQTALDSLGEPIDRPALPPVPADGDIEPGPSGAQRQYERAPQMRIFEMPY